MIEGNIRNPPQQEIILISCRGNQQCTYDISHINSIKVRLEHSTDCAHHKRQANFNSIKVRLELIEAFFHLLQDTYFNSIKVRLERWETNYRILHWFDFISIKVRLELFHNLQPYFLYVSFQFHKGAIRTFISPYLHI